MALTAQQREEIAVFRFGVIADFINNNALNRGERQKLLKKQTHRKWAIPYSIKSNISESSILRWIRLYKNGHRKLDSLKPKCRSDIGMSRVLDETTQQSLIVLRKELPCSTVPHLIKEMQKREIISTGVQLNPSLVYRFLHNTNLMHVPDNQPCDRRKFEADLPNDMWQSDVLHGPMVMIEGRKRKTYLIAFIDDHSRLITHGEFYLSESITPFLDAFEKALSQRGIPIKLYVDNGAAYRSNHLAHVSAELGIALIHARPYQPQGKGKIERFFRTVRGQFLAYSKDTDLTKLNESFSNWLNTDYHNRIHSATHSTPFARFTSRMECLRRAPKELKTYFRQTAIRRVAKDRTISLNNRLYEAPVALIGKRVILLFHEQEPESVEVRYKNESYGLITFLNLKVNNRVKRDRNQQLEWSVPEDKSVYKSGNLWSKTKTEES